jgi:hypothetical protein
LIVSLYREEAAPDEGSLGRPCSHSRSTRSFLSPLIFWSPRTRNGGSRAGGSPHRRNELSTPVDF